MSKLKIDQRTIDEVINHLPPKIVRTYGRHDYAPEKKEALEIWEAELERLTEATNAQV